MDTSALILNKLLQERNLEIWAKLKLAFLDAAYTSVYTAINKHYSKHSVIPSFDELEVSTRDSPTEKILATIKLIDVPDVSIEVAFEALLDQYTQNVAVDLLDKFVDKLAVYDSQEIKDNLASIVLTLDEKTLTTEGVYNMSEVLLFQSEEDVSANKVPMGVNNTFDAAVMPAREELILIGGRRGSGKSICAANICVNQYEAGNTSVFFTIEMTYLETFQRIMSILADVDHQAIKKNTLTPEQVLKLVRTRAAMFENADDLVDKFLADRDRFKFEAELVRTKSLKPDNQIIIIDDRALSLTSVDLHLGKLKAKFGDKLTTAVVDYLNQIVLEGATSQFDWQPQVAVSKKLKELARKYDLLMVSPYQIDEKGEARFAKGILDAADIAILMEAFDKETGAIGFETTKIRGSREMKVTSGINWDTLRISPHEVTPPSKETKDKDKKEKGIKRAHEMNGEAAQESRDF